MKKDHLMCMLGLLLKSCFLMKLVFARTNKNRWAKLQICWEIQHSIFRCFNVTNPRLNWDRPIIISRRKSNFKCKYQKCISFTYQVKFLSQNILQEAQSLGMISLLELKQKFVLYEIVCSIKGKKQFRQSAKKLEKGKLYFFFVLPFCMKTLSISVDKGLLHLDWNICFSMII